MCFIVLFICVYDCNCALGKGVIEMGVSAVRHKIQTIKTTN